jgi:hypothetical protein
MNTYQLNLTNSSTSSINILPRLVMNDLSTLVLNLTGMNETILPLFLKIDWGFGDTIIYDNNIYKIGKTQSIIDGHYSPLFMDTYSNVYYPAPDSLSASLSAQVLVNYANGHVSYFLIPIIVKTYNYSQSIGDLTLINTNILPVEGNLSEHQLKTLSGGYIIEIRGD